MDSVPVNSVYEVRPPIYKDGDGQPRDPVDLRFAAVREEDPDGLVEHVYGPDAEIRREAKGQFVIHFTPPKAGVWYWRVTADGIAFESYFNASPSPLG